MIHLIHSHLELSLVEKQVLPFLEHKKVQLIPFPGPVVLPQKEDHLYMVFLDDLLLKVFLPFAVNHHLKIGILPHRAAPNAISGFGIDGSVKSAVKEILKYPKLNRVDLLYCNQVPVFKSVNVGNVFLLKKEERRKKFFLELFSIFQNIIKISTLLHTPFTFYLDREKPISTSAIGIVVVEHSRGSAIAKNLISESALNDGAFHTLIIAPESLMELFTFMFLNLVTAKEHKRVAPRFIGHLKVEHLVIRSRKRFEYSLDGDKISSNQLELRVRKRGLFLLQGSAYEKEKEGPISHRRIKTENLPKGAKRKSLIKKPMPFLKRASNEEFGELFSSLKKNSRPGMNLLVMLVLSAVIAVFGLFANSSPVIIGAMILAPIITPVVGFSMGVVRNDVQLLRISLTTIFVGSFFSIFFAALLAGFVPLKEMTPEIYTRLSPNLLDLGIAMASGVAAAYAHSKEEIAKSLAGVAVAVALVPPLAVAGLGIGWNSWSIFSGALLLYLANLSGIVMFAGITFFFFGFAPFERAKKGLAMSLLALILIAMPLSLAFKKVLKESAVERKLEKIHVGDVLIKNVRVQYGSPSKVNLRVTSTRPIEEGEITEIKAKVQEYIKQPVQIEIQTGYEFLPAIQK